MKVFVAAVVFALIVCVSQLCCAQVIERQSVVDAPIVTSVEYGPEIVYYETGVLNRTRRRLRAGSLGCVFQGFAAYSRCANEQGFRSRIRDRRNRRRNGCR